MAFRGMSFGEPNEITSITRQAIFDEIIMGGWNWAGRLDEAAFLGRLFELGNLPSTDRRFSTMAEDVWQHRVRNRDGEEDWFLSDPRLNIMSVKDSIFLNFLSQMVHPAVRSDEAETEQFIEVFNRHLAEDGYQIAEVDRVSGRRIFAGVRALPGVQAGLTSARAVADELSSEHVTSQITRMQTSIEADPALAIGSAKEFLESMCKAILDKRGIPRTASDDLPQLYKLTRDTIGLGIDADADVTLKSLTGALATVTRTIAELRGRMGTGHGGAPETQRPPVYVARLAVGVATALGVFLWETHRGSDLPREEAWFRAADWDPA